MELMAQRSEHGSESRPSWLNAEFVRYLCVGLLNSAVGLCVTYFCIYCLKTNDVTANALGYSAGITTSFALNRSWTFSIGGPPVSQFARFLLVTAVAYAANLATVLALIHHLNHNRYLAQAAGALPYTAIGYLGSRFFAFRRR